MNFYSILFELYTYWQICPHDLLDRKKAIYSVRRLNWCYVDVFFLI